MAGTQAGGGGAEIVHATWFKVHERTMIRNFIACKSTHPTDRRATPHATGGRNS
jgi:hypothetical protein